MPGKLCPVYETTFDGPLSNVLTICCLRLETGRQTLSGRGVSLSDATAGDGNLSDATAGDGNSPRYYEDLPTVSGEGPPQILAWMQF